MICAIDEIKIRAKKLQRLADSGDAESQSLVGSASPQRKDCLATISRGLGFTGWPHAVVILGGQAPENLDYVTFLYSSRCGGFLNLWFASYAKALLAHDPSVTYLLPYKRQFIVVRAHYIDALGLDPGDPSWVACGRDWMRADEHVRQGLYAKVLHADSNTLTVGQADRRSHVNEKT